MRTKRDGQALLMVTISLVVMLGMLGLAVDLGWEFYVHKTARAAADAAAISAVRQAARAEMRGPYACSNDPSRGFTCSSLINCGAASGNLATGCQFAAANGFLDGGIEGRQTLRIEANVGSSGCDTATPPNCVPTAPGVAALYWVHVIATEAVPQLFSGILGNTTGVVSADATAALVPVEKPGSLILLNREYDTSGAGTGIDLHSGGGGLLTVSPGGIVMASTGQGGSNDHTVGNLNGGTSVTAKFTYIRGSGTAEWCSNYSNSSCTHGLPDLNWFQDPESGKGQPPINPSSTFIPVLNGSLDTTNSQCSNTGVCPSGNYYATRLEKDGTKQVATGGPITVASGMTFTDKDFGEFYFFGGVTFLGDATLGPGRYVLAGAQAGNPLLDIGNGNVSGGTDQDAGRMFLLTDSSYGGLGALAASKGIPTLGFAPSTIKTGHGSFAVYGLNLQSAKLPQDLKDFATPIVIWQDQRNSTIQYDSDGYVKSSPTCGGDGADRACPTGNNPKLTELIVKGGNTSTLTTLTGLVYQPRGAWTEIHSTINFAGGLALVTGALDMQGSPTLTLTGDGLPLTTLTSALVR